MNIMLYVSKIINRYGCTAKIENDGNIKSTRAFFEPLRYRYREIGNSYRRLAGKLKTNTYLLICTPDVQLEQDSTVIHLEKNKYIVKRCETYYVSDSPVYVWAVLSPFGKELEDDYEPNRKTG